MDRAKAIIHKLQKKKAALAKYAAASSTDGPAADDNDAAVRCWVGRGARPSSMRTPCVCSPLPAPPAQIQGANEDGDDVEVVRGRATSSASRNEHKPKVSRSSLLLYGARLDAHREPLTSLPRALG